MTIDKLPSGSYRIRQQEKGKRYTVIVDHKPSQNEAVRLLAKEIEKAPSKSHNMTLYDACESYIDNRANIMSPSTVAEYRRTVKRIPTNYSDLHIFSITSETLQSFTNEYTVGRSAKTVKNMVTFIMSVLKANDIVLKQPTLPQKEKKSPYIPTKEDVSAVFEQIKGTKYEIPITLAALGLRRSEICALTIDDLDGNYLTIDKALVKNENGEWVTKSTKTTASTRKIVIPGYLADMIREQGYVFNGFPGTIRMNLIRAQNRAGVQHFPLHKLRHFFASYMHDLGYSDKQIQEAGGWQDGSRVMKFIYQHAMDMENAQKGMADSIGNLRK